MIRRSDLCSGIQARGDEKETCAQVYKVEEMRRRSVFRYTVQGRGEEKEAFVRVDKACKGDTHIGVFVWKSRQRLPPKTKVKIRDLSYFYVMYMKT
jgi:hypothetical protein